MSHPLTTNVKSKGLNEGYSTWWLELRAFQSKLFGKTEEAIERTVLLLKHNSPKTRFSEVRFLLNVQAYQEAREYLEIINSKENLAEIKFLLAKCYLGMGFLAEAKVIIEEALESDPGKAEYWDLMADCQLEQGDWRAAILALDNSMRAAPKKADTIYRLGMIYAHHGETLEALRCFQGCCQLRPHHAPYWEMKAEIHLQLEQISQASRSFEKALRLGVNPELAARLAYCYVHLDKIKKGIKYYELVLKHEPDHYDAICNLAAVYQNQGRSIEALNLLERAQNIYPNDAVLLNNLAYTFVHLGRTRRAIENYHSALKLAPDNPLIIYNLSVCLVRKGSWEEGIETLTKLLEINPHHSEGWALLGNIYDQIARYDIAIDCFNKSMNLAS